MRERRAIELSISYSYIIILLTLFQVRGCRCNVTLIYK